MRRELAAAAALLLLALGAAWNVAHVHHVTEELSSYVTESQEAFLRSDYAAAEQSLRRAMEEWESRETYVCICLRHSEIDGITSAFYDLLSHIYDRSPECLGGYEELLLGLRHLAKMETPSPGSIF